MCARGREQQPAAAGKWAGARMCAGPVPQAEQHSSGSTDTSWGAAAALAAGRATRKLEYHKQGAWARTELSLQEATAMADEHETTQSTAESNGKAGG